MPKENPNTENYDDKGNASHYKKNRIDGMIMYERIFGTEAVMHFCEINVLKYRLRMGNKDEPLDLLLTKIKWYEEAATFYFNKMKSVDRIPSNSQKQTFNL